MDAATIAVFTGNANPQLAHDIVRHLQMPLGRASVGRFSDGEVTVELMENVRGRDVFIVQPTSSAGERSPDGAAGDGGCLPARLGRPHHRGDAVLRLRAAGSAPARDARADHGQARRQHDRERWRAPRADGRPARGPDPGVLRHPRGQRLCLAGAARRGVEAEVRRPGGRLAGRRRRGARPGVRQAARRRGPRDHRQAAAARQRVAR